jgi:AmmeMemoRadiSam system protein B
MFYPAESSELRQMVDGFLQRVDAISVHSPKVILVPHAGYIYSGEIAASAYARVHPAGIERVVLIGPSHHVAFEGLAAPESLRWETPLGEMLIDFQSLEKISTFPQVVFSEEAHRLEHSLEVQLPFLQLTLGAVQIVPLVVGDAGKDEVAEVLEALWGGPETLVVVSTDLSHYHDYDTAAALDQVTMHSILSLNARSLMPDGACGYIAVAGLLDLAVRKGLRVELLDLKNSGDTAGSHEEVVGYGAFAFYE